jgi:radical SAM superfamily enzyme YgiQ (UPF0313 family)
MSNLILIYPRWSKIPEQTEFHLPPHGPVCVAAAIPASYSVTFIDENVDAVDFDNDYDIVLISMMLTCQLPRGIEIAKTFRKKGLTIIAGGIATMLHAAEIGKHVDSVFLGEVEDGRLSRMLEDHAQGKLAPCYDYFHNPPPIESVGTARRSILNQEKYVYRGVPMVALAHASRGCKFNCFPCCTNYLGGRVFRPRPIEKVVEELTAIDNNRIFLVDNSLAQDKTWLLELFEALIPLKKKWISHPILDDDEVLAKAAEAGCWYVYQAVFDTSDHIRNRIKRLQEFGIGVEAAVLLGTDNQSVSYIKELIDFLLEIDVDMAEFSILTPFPHTPATERYEKQNRILHKDWARYTTAEVVFQPKQMTAKELQEMYHYSWKMFYNELSQPQRMSRLFFKVLEKELADGTCQPSLNKASHRTWKH